jgi:Na+/phosphate symporter
MDREATVEAPERIRSEVAEMCQKTVTMLQLTWEGFRRQDTAPLQRAEKLGQEIHRQEKILTTHAVERAADPMAASGVGQDLFFGPMHLERIGDQIELLVRATKSMIQEGVPFTERAMREVNTLFEKGIELLECVRDVIQTKNRVLVRHILEEGERYQAMADAYALSHQQRLIEGVCMPKASSIFVAVLDYLKGIEWHTRQIAQKLAAVTTAG